MTLIQLKYFIEVAEIGNFTKAAKHIHTSQPTISRQIQMLEEELGYALFVRHSKPLKLTKSGQVLYEGVKGAISQINNSLDMAEIASAGKTGTLSVAFQAGYFSEYSFFELIKEMRKTWPTLKIQCNKFFAWEQLKGLKNGGIDVAIGPDFPHWQEAGLTVKKLQAVETLIVMSADHALAKKKTLEYDDLDGETFFLTNPNGYHVEKMLKGKYATEHIKQVEVRDSEIAYFKVLSENGLTISNTDDPTIQNNPFYHCIPLPATEDDYYVCIYNEENDNPVLHLFLSLLENYRDEDQK